MKKNLLLVLMIFLYSGGVLFANCDPNSGPTTSCDICKARPYKICVDGKIETKCLVNPSTKNGIIKMNLPICIEPANSFGKTVSTRIGGQQRNGVVMSPEYNIEDFNTAANKWNCICGFDASNGNCGTTIPVCFSVDYKKFKDAYSDPSNANVNDGDNCFSSNDTMYLNITSEFEQSEPSLGNNNPLPTERPCYHTLMNNGHIMSGSECDFGNYTVVGAYYDRVSELYNCNYKIYNLVDVVMRQVGEILGMGYSSECGCGFSIINPECIYPVNENSTISSYFGLGGPDNNPNGDCDKCMFKQLYCPEELCPDGIYDYEPQSHKVYPNPGEHIITIDFTLPSFTDNLQMYIQNSLGNVVLIPIENGTFAAGEHSEFINVDNLPVGVYYIIIESGTYRTAQPITIIGR